MKINAIMNCSEINRSFSEVNLISDETEEGMDESASTVNDLAEKFQA